MAGLPGLPVGSIGATNVDFTPLLERLRLQTAQQRFGADLQERRATRISQEDLARSELAQRAQQFAQRQQLAQGQLAEGARRFTEQQALERERMAEASRQFGAQHQPRIASLASEEEQTEKKLAAVAEEAEKDRAFQKAARVAKRQEELEDRERDEQILAAASSVEADLIPSLEQIAGTAGPEFDIVTQAKRRIAQDYADNPGAMTAALAKVSEYSQGKYQDSVNELNKQLIEKKISAQDAANIKAELENEEAQRRTEFLRDALSGNPEYADLFDKVARGETLSGSDLQRVASNPYLFDMIQSIAKLRQVEVDPREQELAIETVEEQLRGLRLRNEELESRLRDIEGGDRIGPEGKRVRAADLTDEEATRISKKLGEQPSGFFATDIGQSTPAEVANKAIAEIKNLEGDDSEYAVDTRAKLSELARLIGKIRSGAIGSAFDDLVDRSGRLQVKGLTRTELDRVDELIAELNEIGVEVVD